MQCLKCLAIGVAICPDCGRCRGCCICDELLALRESAALARVCVYCGCSELRACPGGCSWISVNPAICSSHQVLLNIPDDAIEIGAAA